jgi:hypothetical protein
MDGYQVARAMRADPALAGVTLIALTGRAGPDDVTKAREAGFGGHLAKPPSPEAIMMMLRDARSYLTFAKRRCTEQHLSSASSSMACACRQSSDGLRKFLPSVRRPLVRSPGRRANRTACTSICLTARSKDRSDEFAVTLCLHLACRQDGINPLQPTPSNTTSRASLCDRSNDAR